MKQVHITFGLFAIFIISTIISTYGQGPYNSKPPSLIYNLDLEQIETFNFDSNFSSKNSLGKQKDGNPLWAGFSIKANIDSKTTGENVSWPDGSISWIARITSDNAPALGLVFENVTIPVNAMFYVYSENNPAFFSTLSADDVVSRTISTPPILSESIIIEYTERFGDENLSQVGSFVIAELVVISNGINNLYNTKDIGYSDPCQVNINCSPEGDDWQNQKRGIARILLKSGSSWYWCSGSLINNTNLDGKPYFLTAEHCGGEASESDRSVWQFYFNFENAECTSSETPPSNLITGCFLRAKGPLDGGSDFQLLELSSSPPLEWQPYYNGWNRKTTGSTGGVSIHHPSGDVKKISTYTTSLTSASPAIGQSQMATNSAWRVTWSATANGHGVTEGGSSGSPIFGSEGLIVGSLSGGSSSCNNLESPDYYGKFNYHWASNGTTNQTKLEPWLDPTSSGVQFLQGFDPSDNLYANFTVDKTFALVGEQITFSDLSTGSNIESWSWNFGEGALPESASGKGPHSVYYSTIGSKTVSLTINEIETSTKTDYITILDMPENAILYELFEGDVFPPDGWLNVDYDGDSHDWFSFNATDAAYSGIKCAASASWMQSFGPLTPDNWLITPPIEITHDNYILDYYVSAQDPEWPSEKYGIFISNKGTRIDDFTEVYVETLSDASWHNRQINLSSFLGDIIYIAFRHFDCIDWYYIKIDDVLVTGGSDLPSDQAQIHSFNFEEGGVVKAFISNVEGNIATIVVKVVEDTNFSSLTPIIGISHGATINYVYPTVMDFSSPVEFDVTSESGTTINTYTVSLEYADKRTVTFSIADSDDTPIGGALIQIDQIQDLLTTDDQGIAYIDLVDGTYTFSISADNFDVYEGAFTVDESPLDISIRLVRVSNSPLSIDNIEVYPNPFSNLITLNNIGNIERILISNTLGNVILDYSPLGLTKETISTQKLPNGFYLITFETKDGERLVKKMIKQ